MKESAHSPPSIMRRPRALPAATLRWRHAQVGSAVCACRLVRIPSRDTQPWWCAARGRRKFGIRQKTAAVMPPPPQHFQRRIRLKAALSILSTGAFIFSVSRTAGSRQGSGSRGRRGLDAQPSQCVRGRARRIQLAPPEQPPPWAAPVASRALPLVQSALANADGPRATPGVDHVGTKQAVGSPSRPLRPPRIDSALPDRSLAERPDGDSLSCTDPLTPLVGPAICCVAPAPPACPTRPS